MKKLKIYLDTSVISHLTAEDTPDKMADTLVLWEELKQGKYTAVISNITVEELEQCYEPKRSLLIDFIRQIKIELITQNPEVDALANEYITNEVLKQKSYDDCLHIACAVISNCDFIVSWNFKHLVNYKTIKGIKIVNSINDYREIGIFSPTMVIESEE